MAKLVKTNSFSNSKFVSNGSFYRKLAESTLKIWSTFSNTLSYQSQDSSISTAFEEPLGGTLTYSSDNPFANTFFVRGPSYSLTTQNSTTSAQIAFSTEERTSFNAKPFTIMFWMKASDASYQTVLTLGGSSIAVGVNGTTGPGGSATVRLIADFTGTDGVFLSDVSNTLSTCQNTWVHVCVSYDPRSTSNVPKFYVNGERLASNTSTPPVGGGMLLVTFLNLGSDGNPGTTNYSNYMHFNDVVISDEDVKAIYNATLYQAFASRTGVISNPVRIMLQEKDNHTGSYPTIARTGDHDFSGKYASFYDDTNTVNFVSNNRIVYPTVLSNDSKWVSGGVATPNILQGLLTTGNMKRGVSDRHISFTPGENLSPFNESRIYIDNNSSFYATGSATETIPGFEQRLASKVAVVIDTNPSISTDFFFSTGTLPNASGISQGVNTGIGYFNWVGKRWEVIGDLTTGSNIDILNNDESIRKNGLLACVPANLANSSGETIQELSASNGKAILKTPGLPMSEYGFPFASKYDATGSQLLDMSNYITAPLLLEKIVLEFSATIGPHHVSSLFYGPVVKTFFLMTQKNLSGSISAYQTTILSGTSPGTTFNRTYQHGYSKSIVGFGMISLTYSDFNSSTPDEYKRDLNINVPSRYGTGTQRAAVTGSYRLEFFANSSQKSNFTGLDAFPQTRQTPVDTIRCVLKMEGGRSGFDLSDGRSFVQGVGGLTPVGSHTLSGIKNPGTTTNYTAILNDPDTIVSVSPFVLLPSDKLILGFSNTPNYYATTQLNLDLAKDYTRYEGGLALENVVLSPGSGKLTLYGSLLRKNLPVSPETNQPLTSNAIYESLHDNNPIFDQFDVEPYASLAGTYIDHIITGSIKPWPPLKLTPSTYDRKVLASVAAGQAGSTGSLQRFVKLTYDGLTYIDSTDKFLTGTGGIKFLTYNSTYGMSEGKNLSPSVKIRRDRYGQFRDILESAPFAAFYISGKNEDPERAVEIGFYSSPTKDGAPQQKTSPEQTHSQNLSEYSTSSLPFFDAEKPVFSIQVNGTKGVGNGRDRTDYPDFWLQPFDVK